MILPEIDVFYRELGEAIKTERIRRNISQESLGDHLELTRASIINLEKGRHRPSVYQLLMIANFLEIEFTSLLPYRKQKHGKKNSVITRDLDKNIISDQEITEKSTKNAIYSFLASIKKTDL